VLNNLANVLMSYSTSPGPPSGSVSIHQNWIKTKEERENKGKTIKDRRREIKIERR
jgi:hypothetical protein